MKLAVYGPQKRLGLVTGDLVVDLQKAGAAYLTSQGERHADEESEASLGHDLTSFVQRGEKAVKAARQVLKFAKDEPDALHGGRGQKLAFQLSLAKLRAPVTESSKFKIMCIGANFADHFVGLSRNSPASMGKERKVLTLEEARAQALATPQWGFYKMGSSVSNPGDDVQYPSRTRLLDYEGEVALIIGRRGKDIRRSELLDHVFGYTLFDDFSLRDNMDKGVMNFARVKNFEGSGALGPLVTLKDEAPDPQDIDFSTSVNGEVRQRGNTKDMIRGFGEWVEFLSEDVELNPGDVIASGTCAGTAADSSKRDRDGNFLSGRFLKPGDVVEVSSKRLGGTLRNRIVEKRS
ncbi:MAG: fumarylacetoacetate hydrolase family protein [Thaumarchaeota archaeon]|nr:fumarylacetoacetate hydrolase family protein [Nitrososphaerota archaeon]